MEYQIVFSNGEKMPFTVHHTKNLYSCEIIIDYSNDFYNSVSDYSFVNRINIKTIEAKGKSLELLLSTIKKKDRRVEKTRIDF